MTSPDILQRGKGDSDNVGTGYDTGFGKYLPIATREARFARDVGMFTCMLGIREIIGLSGEYESITAGAR